MSKAAKETGITLDQAAAEAGLTRQRIQQIIREEGLRTFMQVKLIPRDTVRINERDWKRHLKSRSKRGKVKCQKNAKSS